MVAGTPGPGLLTHASRPHVPPAALAGTARFAQITSVLRRVLVLNLAVAAAKIALGLATGAISILSDGLHSATDSASNIVGLVGVRLASRPPDEDHPYGHRKFETMASLGILLFLLLALVEILETAIGRLRTGGAPEVSPGAFAVMGATLVVNIAVADLRAARGPAAAERGAARRRAPHDQRRADLVHGDRGAARGVGRLPRRRRLGGAGGGGVHRPRLLGDLRRHLTNARRSHRDRRGRGARGGVRRARRARLSPHPQPRFGRPRVPRPPRVARARDAADGRPRPVARRERPRHGPLPADQGRGHPH